MANKTQRAGRAQRPIGAVARRDAATFRPPSRPSKYRGDEVIVRLHPAAVRPHASKPQRGLLALSEQAARSLPEEVVEPLEYLRRNFGLTDIEPLVAPSSRRRQKLASFAPASRTRLAVASSVADADDDDLAGLAVARLDKTPTQAVLKKIAAATSVDFIERVPARWLMAEAADPLRNGQWGLRAIRWFEADRPDASDLTIGVMDSGIDRNHPDLANVDITYHHEGVSARDLLGHGTHVAGVIAAEANNNIGIAGVANSKLAVWKIFEDAPDPTDGEFYVDQPRFLQALVDAHRSGITSLNLSIGGPVYSQTEELLFSRLVESGVTTVAAMGNEYEAGNATNYPAGYAHTVAVGAMAEDRKRSWFSNTGPHIDLTAPGSNVLSTLPTKASQPCPETNYAAWSGTSMATPHVTGAAALVLAKNPGLAPADVTKHLKDTAAKLEVMGSRAKTREHGTGLLDLEAALS